MYREHTIDALLQRALDLRENATDPVVRNLVERALRRVVRELAPFTSATYEGSIQNPLNIQKKVHLGSGAHKIPGYFSIDLEGSADLKWDIRAGIPLPDGQTEEVFCEHFLEHVDYDVSAPLIAQNVYRVLQPGGLFIVGVPDAEAVCVAYVSGDSQKLETYRSTMYSNRDLNIYDTKFDLVSLVFHDEHSHSRYSPHLWGYSYENLAKLLRKAGFAEITKCKKQPDYANPEREFGTLYVVARK